MTFQVSPGVQVKEIDLTSIIPSVSTTRAGFAGAFNKGPVGARTLITSVNQLRSVFGDPVESNAVDFFSAANFLAYTNNLQVVRVVGDDAANANAAGEASGTLIKTVSDYDAQFGDVNTAGGVSMGGTYGIFAARGPGGDVNEGGNAIQVSVADRTTLNITLLGATGSGPSAENGATMQGFLNDNVPTISDLQFHFVVEDSGITSSGLTKDVTDGQLDVANVGLTSGDNLRVKGIPAEPLRQITGLTPGFITGSSTGFATGFTGYGSLTLSSSVVYAGGTGGFLVITGKSGDVEKKVVVRTISQAVAGGSLLVGVTLDGGTFGFAGGISIAAGDVVQFAGVLSVGSTAQGQNGLTAASIDWKYRSNFGSDLPATSVDAKARGATNDLVHIAVVDEFGIDSGNPFDVLEVFDGVSKASNVKDTFGKNLFMQQRVRNDSRHVFLTGFSDQTSNSGGVSAHSGTIAGATQGMAAEAGKVFGTLVKPATVSLTGGTLGQGVTDKITNGYDLFEDSETVDVNILVGGGLTGADAVALANIADKRKDCIAFLSPPKEAVLEANGVAPKSSIKATANTVAYRKGTNAAESGGDKDYKSSNLNIDTSFAVMDSGWKLTFDRYNDVFRYIPLSADTAGVTVRTDVISEPWFSPAGFNRGQILGAVSLAYSPNQAE